MAARADDGDDAALGAERVVDGHLAPVAARLAPVALFLVGADGDVALALDDGRLGTEVVGAVRQRVLLGADRAVEPADGGGGDQPRVDGAGGAHEAGVVEDGRHERDPDRDCEHDAARDAGPARQPDESDHPETREQRDHHQHVVREAHA